jgi:hypothetical protein
MELSKECEVCTQKTKSGLCRICRSVLPKLRLRHQTEVDHGQIIREFKRRYTGVSILLGLSGGVDSSYLAVLAAEAGLNISAFHFDNGWNTALASKNISNIVNKYDIPLKTKIMDWPTFKGLQKSFIMAGVPDVELVTDHAIFSTMAEALLEKPNSVLLSGANFATEHYVSRKFTWHKLDGRNISSINSLFEKVDLSKYPSISVLDWARLRAKSVGARIETPLNDFPYRRDLAVDFLSKKAGFVDYRFKHEESLFTKIYQRSILPKKFGYLKIVDHLDCLLRNNELRKDEVRIKLTQFREYDPMNDYDFNFFLSKLSLTRKQWSGLLRERPRKHSDYPNNGKLISGLAAAGKLLGKRGSQ